MGKKSIIVDFDGTICEHRFPYCGPPEPGVKEALQYLQDSGYLVIIHSVSTSHNWGEANRNEHIDRIKNFLNIYKIPYDGILLADDKPIAFAYIDDRAISYKGNWTDVLNEVKEMEQEDGE